MLKFHNVVYELCSLGYYNLAALALSSHGIYWTYNNGDFVAHITFDVFIR